MFTIDCPWCESPVELETLATAIRCDHCSIEAELADDSPAEVRQAA